MRLIDLQTRPDPDPENEEKHKEEVGSAQEIRPDEGPRPDRGGGVLPGNGDRKKCLVDSSTSRAAPKARARAGRPRCM